MLTKKETAWIIITILILSFMIAFQYPLIINNNIFIFLSAILIIITNILVKKIVARHFHVKISHKIWEFQRYGFYERSYFKKPFPVGLILPFALTIFSLGSIKPLTLLQYNAKPDKLKILKDRGNYRYQEINEEDLAFISVWGFWALIFLAVVGYLTNFPELTRYSIFYGIWNLIPLSNLDGSKVFFGSIINWTILIIVYVPLTIFQFI